MNSCTKTLSLRLETLLEFGGSVVQESLAEIRNISLTGRKNRLYGGILLISVGLVINLYLSLIHISEPTRPY